jgi:predicted amidophosphoribosyltransferase
LKSSLLKRVAVASVQATKTKSERAQNFKGAFEVNRPYWVAEKNVLLMDDVFTTDAKVNEATKTLKMAGAGKNYIFTLGRLIVDKGLDSYLGK